MVQKSRNIVKSLRLQAKQTDQITRAPLLMIVSVRKSIDSVGADRGIKDGHGWGEG